MREPGCGAGAQVDVGAGAGGQLAVAGDEVGMQMGFDDVLDLEVVLAGGVEVDFDVALGIDDGGDAFGTQHVGGVGQAAEVELLDGNDFPAWFGCEYTAEGAFSGTDRLC